MLHVQGWCMVELIIITTVLSKLPPSILCNTALNSVKYCPSGGLQVPTPASIFWLTVLTFIKYFENRPCIYIFLSSLEGRNKWLSELQNWKLCETSPTRYLNIFSCGNHAWNESSRRGCSAHSQTAPTHSPELQVKMPHLVQPGYLIGNRIMAPNGEVSSRNINNTCSL